MMPYYIRLLDHIAPIGLNQFHTGKNEYLYQARCKKPSVILVRSSKLSEDEIPDSVEVIGRAGVGTNNIPVKLLTQRGIPILNTPGANANAVKELVIAGILLASRNLCQAFSEVQQLSGEQLAIDQWVEANKKKFRGIELPNRTLGVVGLGKIGVKVANCAVELGMKVIGYDEGITIENAWMLASAVNKANRLQDIFENCDFITLHVPLTEKTFHLINKAYIHSMKSSAVLLNFARRDIVDHEALRVALKNKKIKGYVCDFPAATMQGMPNVIALPHLGASTEQAENNCAEMIVNQVMDYLENGNITNSVNFPTVKLLAQSDYRLAVINKNVPNMVAQISAILSKYNINIVDMLNRSRDDIAYTMMDLNQMIDKKIIEEISAVQGILRARLVASSAQAGVSSNKQKCSQSTVAI